MGERRDNIVGCIRQWEWQLVEDWLQHQLLGFKEAIEMRASVQSKRSASEFLGRSHRADRKREKCILVAPAVGHFANDDSKAYCCLVEIVLCCIDSYLMPLYRSDNNDGTMNCCHIGGVAIGVYFHV